MNGVSIPDDAEAEPDELLAEFARRGNRAAIIEEVYRRANNHPSGYHVARERGVESNDIVEIADAAWKEYRNPDGDGDIGERMFMLSLSYGHVADHVFAQVDGAEDPTA